MFRRRNRGKLIAAATLAAAAASALALAAAGPAGAAGGWTSTTVAGVPGDNLVLNGVFARTSTDAWAVGQQFQPAGAPNPPAVTFHWNGTGWSSVPVPALSTYGALVGVSASSATDAWAVGFLKPPGYRQRLALLEHWNGSAWAQDTSDAVSQSSSRLGISGVADLSPSDAWAIVAGTSSNSLAHWDGTAWSFASFADATFDPSLGQAISASPAGDVWVVGTGVDPVTSVTIPEAEHFTGGSWHTVPLTAASPKPGTTTVSGVTAISPTDAWAVGSDTSGSAPLGGGTLTEHWDGTSWKIVPSPTVGFEPQLTSVAARSASDVVAVGNALPSENGGPYRDVILRWNGTSWSSDDNGAFPGAAAGAGAAPGGAQEWIVDNNQILSHS